MNDTTSASIEHPRKSIGKTLLRPNVGGIDRTVRLLLGMILLATGLLLRIQGHHLALIVIIIGIVMLAGSIIRFCPLYVVFGISTADRKTGAHPQ
jgi:hypothetical protein